MNARPGLRIGELAERSGRSVHAIRWYDAQGLIPGVVRDGGGRRVFDARHVEWLALLERLRSTGMSIAQMRAYAALVQQGRSSLARQRDVLAAHRAHVAQTIAAWGSALELIDAKLDFYAQWIETGVRPATEAVTRKGAAASQAFDLERGTRARRAPSSRAMKHGRNPA